MGNLHAKLVGFVLFAGTLVASTGCMTTPGHYENVGSVSDEVTFTGWLQEPDRWVRIQARTPGAGRWVTIGWARSDDTPYHYSGGDWYYWETNRTVPPEYWIYLDGHFWAEVRAVDYLSNEPLYTFEAGYFSYFDYREPLEDLWADHGHGASVTIAAD